MYHTIAYPNREMRDAAYEKLCIKRDENGVPIDRQKPRDVVRYTDVGDGPNGTKRTVWVLAWPNLTRL
jgi:hypothetical protein